MSHIGGPEPRQRPVASALLLMVVWWVVNYGFGAAPIPGLQPPWFPHLGLLVTGTLSLVAVIGAALVLRRQGWIGQRSIPALAGWRGSRPRALWLLTPMLIVALSYLWIGRDGIPGIVGTPGFMASLAIGLLMVGLTEETASRGIPLALLSEAGAVWRSVLLTSAVFGLWHLGNGIFFGQSTGETLWQVAATSAFGILFAGARLAVVSLWPLVLLHALGDWTQLVSPGAAPLWYQLAVMAFQIGWGVVLVLWSLRRSAGSRAESL